MRAIRYFAEREPDSIKATATTAGDDFLEGTLLHDAVARGAPAELVRFFLDCHPEATKVKDGGGFLPLERVFGYLQ